MHRTAAADDPRHHQHGDCAGHNAHPDRAGLGPCKHRILARGRSERARQPADLRTGAVLMHILEVFTLIFTIPEFVIYKGLEVGEGYRP